MSETPRTDAERPVNMGVRRDFARQLETELAAKERELADMKRRYAFTYCAYCGATFEIDKPESTDAVSEHIKTCEKHPMREVERALMDQTRISAKAQELEQELKRELAAWGEAVKTELGLDVAPDCEADLIAALRWYRLKMEKELAELRGRLADIDEAHRAVMEERCAGDEVHCTCVPFLRAEIERLNNVIAGDAGIKQLVVDEKGLRLAASHPMMHALACEMVSFFKSAVGINYVEVSMCHEEIGPFVLTLQRREGKTPNDLKAEAEKELTQTRDAVRGIMPFLEEDLTDEIDSESVCFTPEYVAAIKKLRSCLPATDVVKRAAEKSVEPESGWLIERTDPKHPGCVKEGSLGECNGVLKFTVPDLAIRYSRRVDADAAARTYGLIGVVAVAHSWDANATPPATGNEKGVEG